MYKYMKKYICIKVCTKYCIPKKRDLAIQRLDSRVTGNLDFTFGGGGGAGDRIRLSLGDNSKFRYPWKSNCFPAAIVPKSSRGSDLDAGFKMSNETNKSACCIKYMQLLVVCISY